MRKRSIAVALLTVLVASGASAGAKRPGRDISPADRELIIRQAYANLAEHVAAGGAPIAFKVESFRTFEAADLATVQWLDLVTMPGGDMLDMAREQRDWNGEPIAVAYRPTWKLGAADYLQSPEGQRLIGMTADRVIAEVATKKPTMGSALAITTFVVTVEFQDMSRTYTASAIWLPPAPGRDATVVLMDHVTQGVEQALQERPRPAVAAVRQRSKAFGAQCQPDSATSRLSQQLEGTDGHFFGHHAAIATVDFTCTCRSDCYELCSSNFIDSTCEDTGLTSNFCHNMATAVNASTNDREDARAEGPGCGAGLGCIEKSCAFCWCNLGVSVSIRGIDVSFSNNGGEDWSGNVPFGHQCGRCVEVTPPPPPDGGGGGGDGNGGPFDQDPNGGSGTGGGGLRCCSWGSQSNCYYTGTNEYRCDTVPVCLVRC
jgi:hypothetical protein